MRVGVWRSVLRFGGSEVSGSGFQWFAGLQKTRGLNLDPEESLGRIQLFLKSTLKLLIEAM